MHIHVRIQFVEVLASLCMTERQKRQFDFAHRNCTFQQTSLEKLFLRILI